MGKIKTRRKRELYDLIRAVLQKRAVQIDDYFIIEREVYLVSIRSIKLDEWTPIRITIDFKKTKEIKQHDKESHQRRKKAARRR